MKTTTAPEPRYQLLEGCLEEVQAACNEYAAQGYRLVSMAAVRGGAMIEYCAVLERREEAA